MFKLNMEKKHNPLVKPNEFKVEVKLCYTKQKAPFYLKQFEVGSRVIHPYYNLHLLHRLDCSNEVVSHLHHKSASSDKNGAFCAV